MKHPEKGVLIQGISDWCNDGLCKIREKEEELGIILLLAYPNGANLSISSLYKE